MSHGYSLVVRIAKERWMGVSEQKRCRWLGHSSYKCAGCKLGYVQVRALSEHDEKCADCGAYVFVTREYDGDKK